MQIIFLATIALVLLTAADARLFPNAKQDTPRPARGRGNPRRVTPRRRQSRRVSPQARGRRCAPSRSSASARWWWE